MTEVITLINSKPYGLNLNYEPPEVSCFDCFYYRRTYGFCVDRKESSKSRYAECQAGGSKSLWRPRLGR